MEILDYIVVIIFSLAIVVAGMSFGKGKTDMKSFFAAGGAVPWPINGLSLFMSFFSAGTFVVWGAIAYQHGWVAVTIQWSMCIAGLVIAMSIAPKWREARVLTVAEFINKRLGSSVQQMYTWLFLALSLAYTGAFLYPVAVIVNVATGFGIQEVIIFLGLMIILYTATGGLWAVVVTDVLQFFILTAAIIIVIPLALANAGGLTGFVNNAPEDFFRIFSGEYTIGFIVAFTFYHIVFIGGNWAYVQRYTSVRDPAAAKKVGYLFSALYVISPVVWMLPPMLYRIIDPGLEGLDHEGAYLLMVKDVLPIGMLGLMLGGLVFATASSVNTTMNLSAAVVTNDIFKRLRPQASNVTLVLVGRVATILFGAGTIGIALMVPAAGGIVEVVLSVAALTGAPLYAPPIWALFSKRQTGRSIIFITLASLSINLFFKFVTPALWGLSLERASEMILGVGGPLLMLACYELWAMYNNATCTQYKRYIQRLVVEEDVTEKIRAETEENALRQNKYGIKVITIALAFTGFLIFALSFIANEANILVGSVGALIAGIAWLVWISGKRNLENVEKHIR